MATDGYTQKVIGGIRCLHIPVDLAGIALAICMTVLPSNFGRQHESDFGGMSTPTLSFILV
jgi:hypothetical protein